MKWTPQNTITSALVFGRCLRELQRIADEVGEILDLGLLVVVRQDHGVALALERADLGLELGGRHAEVGCG